MIYTFQSPDNRFKFAKIQDGRQKNKWPIVIKAFETGTGEAKRVIVSTVYHHHFTVYGEGAQPLSKPHEHSFRVGARGNGSLFRVRKAFFPREKHKTTKQPTKCANCYKVFETCTREAKRAIVSTVYHYRLHY